MPKKKLRSIWNWKKERSLKRSGRLRPAAGYAFRARRNRKERSGSQWNKQVIYREG